MRLSRESDDFMLVMRPKGEISRAAAQTGPPAKARTALTPIVRRNVLLPAMFGPVRTSTAPAPARA